MKITGNLILVLCLGAALAACKDAAPAVAGQEMPVKVVRAASGAQGSRQEFSFISVPFRTSELSFRVGGPIDRFEVYAGNYYKQGDIIAEIDPRDFHIRKQRTEAVYQQAKAEFGRIEALYGKNNISASTFEKAKADYISAKTAYETAVNELEDTRLVAPFNGYAGEVYMEKFQDVKPSQPVISFIDIDRLKIETYVTQEVAFSPVVGQEASLRFDALPEKEYRAKVVEVSKNTTANNLSYLLTALLPNSGGQLPAGMSGKLSLQLEADTLSPAVIVPQKAVCHRPAEGDYVWAVDPDTRKVARKKVTLGKLLPGGNIVVISGLSPEETVAVSGLRFLSDGMTVRITGESHS